MTTFFEQLKTLAENTPELAPVYWVETRPLCDECREFEVMEHGDICEHCKKEWEQHYQVMSLAGRCANGSELDHGTRYHAVELDRTSAFCGAKPGRRSVGWTRELNKEVTCPRCIARLAKIAQRAESNSKIS